MNNAQLFMSLCIEDLLDRKVALIELAARRLKREIQEKSLRII
jgi:hypothetical protein